jgi:membrane protein DedA with SNARE-associated domain
MTEIYAVVIVVGVTIIISIIFHYLRPLYLQASLLSALTSTVVYQVLSYLEGGYLDPFFLIGLVTGTFLALAISLIVGIPFLVYRRRKRLTSAQT